MIKNGSGCSASLQEEGKHEHVNFRFFFCKDELELYITYHIYQKKVNAVCPCFIATDIISVKTFCVPKVCMGVQHTHSKIHGGGFHCSGCPSIQSDQTLTLGRSSRRSVGKVDTRTIGSSSSETSPKGTGSETHRQIILPLP